MLDFQIKLGCLSQLVGLKVLMKFGCNSTCYTVHSKKRWVVSTQIWVKYGETQMLG